MPICYEQTFAVHHHECDPWKRMTPGAVLRRVQDVSTAHCTSLDIDDAYYKATGTAFLLSRLSLQVGRMPVADEEIRIETRAYGMRRAVYHRVTSLHAANGEKLCEADSRWVLVDVESRRILRKLPEKFESLFNDAPGAEEHEMKMPKPGMLYAIGDKRAAYTLCDSNGHVNNTRYADIVCDHLPLEMLKKAPPKAMLLSYHKEIPLGAGFSFSGATCENGAYYFLAGQDDTKFFEAAVTF